jgi:hypothetical protein
VGKDARKRVQEETVVRERHRLLMAVYQRRLVFFPEKNAL